MRLSMRKARVSHWARKTVVFQPSRANLATRASSCQKRHTTGLAARTLAPPQPPLPTPSRSGSARPPARIRTKVTKPPKRPRPMAASVSAMANSRSEEHTSELQSLMRISYAVFCLKKKKNKATQNKIQIYEDQQSYQ